LAPFIQLDSAHAGHTDLHGHPCRVQLVYGARGSSVIRISCGVLLGRMPAQHRKR
jgi:hypothetical protein